MKRIYFKVLFLISVILLTSNFYIVARASGIVRHLMAWELFSSHPTFGWEPAVTDLADPWFSLLKWHKIYPNTDRWRMTDWEDSDIDGKLSASDHVEMHNYDTGEKQWFIVDRATVAIYWLWWNEITGWGGETHLPGSSRMPLALRSLHIDHFRRNRMRINTGCFRIHSLLNGI